MVPQPPKYGTSKNHNFFGAYFESTWWGHLVAETNQTATVYTQGCSLSENTFKIVIQGIVTKLWGSNFVKNANYVKFGSFSGQSIPPLDFTKFYHIWPS